MPRKKAKRKHSTFEIIGLAAIGIFVVGIIWLAFFTAQPQTQSQTPTTTSKLAPDFTLTDVDGKTFRLSDQIGKVVVLEFMNSQCPVCAREIPHARQLRSNFGNDVIMASISVPVSEGADTDETLRNFRNENQVGWIAMLDSGQVAQIYSVQATPTILIIDKDGYIRYEHVGFTEAPVLINEVESLAK